MPLEEAEDGAAGLGEALAIDRHVTEGVPSEGGRLGVGDGLGPCAGRAGPRAGTCTPVDSEGTLFGTFWNQLGRGLGNILKSSLKVLQSSWWLLGVVLGTDLASYWTILESSWRPIWDQLWSELE